MYWPLLAWALAAAAPLPGRAADQVYQAPQAFVAEAFGGEVPPPERLWLTAEHKAKIRELLERDLGVLRVRYWARGARTVWILEEIGKDRPITTGLVVDGGALAEVRVLVFRESRGWEVKYPAFTDQFNGARLTDARRLDRRIDGISGATLSVRAVTKLARLALLLDEFVSP